MLRTCQESGGNTSKPQSTWISVFAGSNSTMIKDRKFRKQERIRAACAILLLGAAMQSREDDNKLKEEGCWHDHRACRRSLLSAGRLPYYAYEGLAKVSPTWHGYATGCQESIQPKANARRCGHPRLFHHR